ncbi:MAG: N-acetylmuramoyl-L-alanine amidase, partial [Pseudanabaena sp.]
MRRLIGIFVIGLLSFVFAIAVGAQNFVPPTQLHLTYPPLQHTTTSDRLFFIGTAPKDGNVSINGKAISRTDKGHFAPSLPLQLGENSFAIKYVDSTGDRKSERQINVKVLR